MLNHVVSQVMVLLYCYLLWHPTIAKPDAKLFIIQPSGLPISSPKAMMDHNSDLVVTWDTLEELLLDNSGAPIKTASYTAWFIALTVWFLSGRGFWSGLVYIRNRSATDESGKRLTPASSSTVLTTYLNCLLKYLALALGRSILREYVVYLYSRIMESSVLRMHNVNGRKKKREKRMKKILRFRRIRPV